MGNFCTETAEIWQLVGSVVTILKIVIPLIIIVLAVIDLGKAAIASDDKEMKGAFSKLTKRIIAGVLIFFIPTLITIAFNFVGEFQDNKAEFDVCLACINSPKAEGGVCANAVATAKGK